MKVRNHNDGREEAVPESKESQKLNKRRYINYMKCHTLHEYKD